MTLACPREKCGATADDRKALVDHLKTEHDVSPVEAWIEARQVEKDAADLAAEAEPQPRGLVARLCPRCLKSQPSTGELAVHLTKVHGVDAMAAVTEARATTPPTTEETTKQKETRPMARPCGECGEQGHGRKTCPKALEKLLQSNGSKRAKKTPKAAAKKKTARRPAKRAAAAAATATNGHDPIGAIRTALDQLEAELAGARALRQALAAAGLTGGAA